MSTRKTPYVTHLYAEHCASLAVIEREKRSKLAFQLG